MPPCGWRGPRCRGFRRLLDGIPEVLAQIVLDLILCVINHNVIRLKKDTNKERSQLPVTSSRVLFSLDDHAKIQPGPGEKWIISACRRLSVIIVDCSGLSVIIVDCCRTSSHLQPPKRKESQSRLRIKVLYQKDLLFLLRFKSSM
ncbi:hypothetical protein EVA_17707 [gut metagenome]|uniref:Uncharacterized protein n=1 Tax=gut metagenome TaxID=749906 RepID=J9C2Z4_9ZZZZ